MNRVVQFDRRTMQGEERLARLLIEFDEQGSILRELGFDEDGRITHRFPGAPSLDEYGLMGPNVIAIAGEDPSPGAILMDASDLVPLETFEAVWSARVTPSDPVRVVSKTHRERDGAVLTLVGCYVAGWCVTVLPCLALYAFGNGMFGRSVLRVPLTVLEDAARFEPLALLIVLLSLPLLTLPYAAWRSTRRAD